MPQGLPIIASNPNKQLPGSGAGSAGDAAGARGHGLSQCLRLSAPRCLPSPCQRIWAAGTTRVRLTRGASDLTAQSRAGFVCNSCREQQGHTIKYNHFFIRTISWRAFFFGAFFFPPSFSFCNIALGFKRGRKIINSLQKIDWRDRVV